MTERFVCIHGHFYQPPRENPWLEAIERQPSARPYHDWNERITAECYGPNAEARLLDERGRLIRVVDNYSRISFNFGPTLLSWLEGSAPRLYRAIQEADARSRELFGGHGSAIAQAYGHSILPLATARDRRTQAIWGIADFRRRFSREPEGMWLPETAADVPTLELLADLGLRFTLLAPHQAARVREIGTERWQDAGGGTIDPTRAYRARLPSGRPLALFFYDGPLSRDVAFDGLLHDGHRFAGRLVGAFPDRPGAQLVHVATDGETYGHHHRQGEMALAAALRQIETGGQARLTNYGQFLAAHPPEHEVEIVERSSWSCPHGVERWRSDCGCHTGGGPGWTQGWRAPLRRALEDLSDRLAARWESAAGELFEDPARARDAYIGVVLDRSRESLERFFAAEARGPLAPEERLRALRLLEVERQAMAMFTSCGWFFSDLAGLETRQVLQHAGRAVELAEELFGAPFAPRLLEALARARSNDPSAGDGRAIYLSAVASERVTLAAVAAHDAIGALFDGRPESDRIYAFEVERRVRARLATGRLRFLLAEVDVTSVVTTEAATFTYAAFAWGDPNVQVGVRPGPAAELAASEIAEIEEAVRTGDPARVVRWLDRRFPIQHALEALFRDDRERLLERILADTIAEVEASGRETFERHAPLMRRLAGVGLPLPAPLRSVAEMALHADLKHALSDPRADLAELKRSFEEVKGWGLALAPEELRYALEPAMAELAERLRHDPLDVAAAERLEDLLHLAQVLPLELDFWPPQSSLYKLFEERSDLLVEPAAGSRAAAAAERLRRLADLLIVRIGGLGVD
ncbi:MAG TPA: DUF3536 domain-containing protein [Thermoanaerobaculia bacterium]|nr:DUF3536 domain-containing protein [Thermoanaerobaculia bacterium]